MVYISGVKVTPPLQIDANHLSSDTASPAENSYSTKLYSSGIISSQQCPTNVNNSAVVVSENQTNSPRIEPVAEQSKVLLDNKLSGNTKSEEEFSHISIAAAVNSSTITWGQLDKSRSPKVKSKLCGHTFLALIDSGAEVNALDKTFAESLHIGIKSTLENAKAANQLPLDVAGQSDEPVVIECITNIGPVSVYLGIVLIVANLGL